MPGQFFKVGVAMMKTQGLINTFRKLNTGAPYPFTARMVLLACACFFWVSASGAVWPAGELEVRGQATITQADGTQLPLRDTQYTLFSGDRVAVRNGQALLTLEEGSTLGMSAGSTISVVSEGGLEVTLHQGGLVYSVEDVAGVAHMVLPEATLCTDPNQTDGPSSVGTIEANAEGTLVGVFEGVLVVCDDGLLAGERINAGDRVMITNAGLTPVTGQAGALGVSEPVAATNTTATTNTLSAIGQWMANNPVLAGLAVAAGATGTYYVVFRDDSSEPERPVSP